MENAELKERLRKVANTLCATKMRVDQVEATNRIRACAEELLVVIEELNEGDGADE